MNNGGACKVLLAVGGQPAAAPDPVCDNRIYDNAEDYGEDQVHGQLGAFCEAAPCDGEGYRGERQLEDEEYRGAGDAFNYNAGVEESFGQAAQEGSAFSEDQTVAHYPENQGAKPCCKNGLAGYVTGVLHAGGTNFEKDKSALHQQNQNCCHHNPQAVQREVHRSDRVICRKSQGWE
ncbi:hypothetical protein D3C75_793730 [compost metagenome]